MRVQRVSEAAPAEWLVEPVTPQPFTVFGRYEG